MEIGGDVILHVYHLDSVSGWFNDWILNALELGAFHVGVEIYCDEWSFQYFDDMWDDDSCTGVLRNEPKQHRAFIYRDSVPMGLTTLKPQQVLDLVVQLQEEWPANSYHLTQRNCIDFARKMCELLQVPEKFPDWTGGVAQFSNKYAPIKSVVNFGWLQAKNYMISKQENEKEKEEQERVQAELLLKPEERPLKYPIEPMIPEPLHEILGTNLQKVPVCVGLPVNSTDLRRLKKIPTEDTGIDMNESFLSNDVTTKESESEEVQHSLVTFGQNTVATGIKHNDTPNKHFKGDTPVDVDE